MRIPVIVLFAPTASGKTALSIKLFGKSSLSCFKDKAELISADSMQVYKGLDIGTAKPDENERKELKHHLIDILEPDCQFSVADFVSRADSCCSEIFSRGKIPLVAGGTGFYIRNFILGLPETPVSDEKIRNQLKERIKKEGKEILYAELKSVDPESAAKINVNDEYRICRALEVFYSTGKPRSSFKMSTKMRENFNFKVLILETPREKLYERINLRVEKMFENGLEQEIHSLYKKGFGKSAPGMQAIGYREWFLEDGTLRSDSEQVLLEIQHDSRKYAKKQYTFMADIPGAVKIDASDDEKMYLEVQRNLKQYFEEIQL
ncbi:MAG: tRNA (adenosine(37)-N6)-dimethylallyltransferase MiaA [Treponema sp.]|jgi:tRNA dimethylallyltransferase|nr:tRNA (adenosine(37)-N6)-dimethylallyltransferase MiaA [Treponema sp.]